ncbi:hypothetical protein [Thalassoglobus neptunius]|nr:hypothetical protein [Thalassoglobus neptunius]
MTDYKNRSRWTALLVAASLTVCVGCSKSNPLNRQAVQGVVTLQGKPITSGSIEFHPQGDEGTISGATIKDGSYYVDPSRGVPPGSYIVRVFASDEDTLVQDVPGESRGVVAKQIVPPEFNVKSQLYLTVKTDQKNVFDVEIPTMAN